jgi:hypothetical protein
MILIGGKGLENPSSKFFIQGFSPKLPNSKCLIDPLNDVQKSFAMARFKGNELRFLMM